jgi:2-keto-4-pentenoate hydratase/2-oxohepta-3-ene-1,7-dioic acid hydratase in catechol pathway
VPFETAWAKQFGVRRPGRIVFVRRNFAAHAGEENAQLPAEPLLFAKLLNTVIQPEEPILLPQASKHPDAEAELALVVAKTARLITRDPPLALPTGTSSRSQSRAWHR